MREIRPSGLMSGDWKRNYGTNCDTGIGETAIKRFTSPPTATAPVVDFTCAPKARICLWREVSARRVVD